MYAPADADDWVALTADPLSVGAVAAWAPRPHCGAYVVFAGTVRDHAEGRAGVTSLEYEAYAEQAEARMRALVDEARRRWPDIGRAAVLHRTGVLQLEEVSVVVAVSTPHRGDSFQAARWCIDTLKATVPIWKRETWKEGAAWGTGARDVEELQS